MTKFYWDITFLCPLGLLELASKTFKTKNNNNKENRFYTFCLWSFTLCPTLLKLWCPVRSQHSSYVSVWFEKLEECGWTSREKSLEICLQKNLFALVTPLVVVGSGRIHTYQQKIMNSTWSLRQCFLSQPQACEWDAYPLMMLSLMSIISCILFTTVSN